MDQNGEAGVRAALHYLAPGSRVNRRFVGPGVELNTGTYETHQVLIRDARTRGAPFDLDTHGFTLAGHESAVADFRDKAEVEQAYPCEVDALIKALTGADMVLSLGWILRSAGETGAEVQPPAADVHVDIVPETARRRFLEERPEVQGRGYSRFLITSLWRAFSPPPQDRPLALCEAGSVGAEEGVSNTLVWVDAMPSAEAMLAPIEGEDRMPAASVFRYSPAHRWWYFPDMTRGEVLLFKLHDSDRTRAWRTPHSAFADPSRPDARTRESIEFRTVAYFA